MASTTTPSSSTPIIWAVINGIHTALTPTAPKTSSILCDIKGVPTQMTHVGLTTDIEVILPGNPPKDLFDLLTRYTYLGFAKDTDFKNPTLIIDRKRMDSEWEHMVMKLLRKIPFDSPKLTLGLMANHLARARVIGTVPRHKARVQQYWEDKKAKYELYDPALDLDINPLDFEIDTDYDGNIFSRAVAAEGKMDAFIVAELADQFEALKIAIQEERGDEVFARMQLIHGDDKETPTTMWRKVDGRFFKGQ